MSLKDVVVNAAKTAYNVVDSMLLDAIYTSKAAAGYDPNTGAVTPGADVLYSVRVLREEYSDSQIDGQNIRSTDLKYSWPFLGMPNVEPKTDDYLVIVGTGERWNVVRASTDPVKATWTVQVRK